MPVLPEVPVEPELPEVPVEPELPDVPELPEEPDVPVDPDVPELPLVPDEPEEPDVPLDPEEPDVPLLPFCPEVPDEPFCPDVPELPFVPEVPELPDIPDVPDDPAPVVTSCTPYTLKLVILHVDVPVDCVMVASTVIFPPAVNGPTNANCPPYSAVSPLPEAKWFNISVFCETPPNSTSKVTSASAADGVSNNPSTSTIIFE